MIPATFPNWGERSWLYDKSLQYVMSLDLLYQLPVHPNAVVGTTTRLPMVAVPPRGEGVSTYRTSGALLFRSGDLIEREVPSARLLHGQDGLALTEEGAVELEGRLLLEVDTAEPIALGYQGMLTLQGGTMQLATMKTPKYGSSSRKKPKKSYEDSIPGTAFVIFDASGNVIREMKHQFLPRRVHTKSSVTVVREWFDEANPDVQFKMSDGALDAVLIRGSNSQRYDLLERDLGFKEPEHGDER
jgi:hypothetical protein